MGIVHHARALALPFGSSPARIRKIEYSPVEVVALALATGRGDWGPRMICYPILVAFLGLDPREVSVLRVDDVVLPTSGPGVLAVRRMLRVELRFPGSDEQLPLEIVRRVEPLPIRLVPVPSWLVPVLRLHIQLFANPVSGWLFALHGEPIDPSLVTICVWWPAVARMYPDHIGSRLVQWARNAHRSTLEDLQHCREAWTAGVISTQSMEEIIAAFVRLARAIGLSPS